jgi:hypothetical protein
MIALFWLKGVRQMRLLLLSLILFPSTVFPQTDAREIWDSGFLQKRPAPTNHSPQGHSDQGHSYKVQGTAHQAQVMSQAAIGITVWRLRLPTPGDTDSRLLVYDSSKPGSEAMIPERIDFSKPLHVGDRIRIGIEVPAKACLYVIDRERYRDGTFGNPVLVFPALTLNQGQNQVEPGQLIEIPPEDSLVKSLRLTKSRNDYVGEDLIFVVSPQPLKEVTPAAGEQSLPSSLVNEWDKEWGTDSLRMNQESSRPETWTIAEKDAVGPGSPARLTQADPMPAVIMSIPPAGDRPFLVHFPIDVQ